MEILKSGGIIAYPTESFYALGVLVADEEAVENLFCAEKEADKKTSTYNCWRHGYTCLSR